MSITLFSKNFSDKAEEIKIATKKALDNIEVKTSINEKQKEDIVNSVLNQHITFPQIIIEKENIRPNLEHLSLTLHEADRILNNYSFSSSQPRVGVSKVTYSIPFSGSTGNLDIATKFPKTEFKGELSYDAILLEFYFQGDVDTHASLIKQQKDNFVQLILENQDEIASKSTNLRSELFTYLTEELNNIIIAKRKNLDDTKKFL